MDDVVDKDTWGKMLVSVIRSPAGLESLSSHFWHLLDKLVSATQLRGTSEPHNAEVMMSLENAGDWEKLEIWMVVMWESLSFPEMLKPESMLGIQQTTLNLLIQRPSAIPRFEVLHEGVFFFPPKVLQVICDEARTKQLPSKSP